MKMLIDSNILVYAINADSDKHETAKQLIEDNLGNLEIAHQNILEAVRVLTHKNFSSPLNTAEATEAILILLDPFKIITPTQTTIHLSLEYIQKLNISGNRIFDAYLAATALSNGIKVIATDNVKDFKIFKGLKVMNPFEPAS